MKIALQAANGKYVCAEMGGDDQGVLRANRDGIGPWETFTVRPQPDGRIALETHSGRFICAENGGGQNLVANRTSVGPWEQFKLIGQLAHAAQVSLECWDGHHYICAEVGNSDPVLVANRQWTRSWETFSLEVVEADVAVDPDVPDMPVDDALPSAARTGTVTAQGRKVVDGDGTFLPLLVSFFWALWGWKFDRDRTMKNLLYVRRRGADGIRIFLDVDGASWFDRPVRSDWPDFEQLLGELIDYCYDVLGMRVQLSLIAGGTGINAGVTARKVANVIRSRVHKVLYCEAANEDNLPDDNARREVVRTLRQVDTGLMVTPCSPPSIGDPTAVKAFLIDQGANFISGHFDRSLASDGPARQVRQTRDWWELGIAGSQGEPAGWKSSVAEQREPIANAMQFGVGAMSGIACYVNHPGPGVRGGSRWDVGPWSEMIDGVEQRPFNSDKRFFHPRESNFWEVPNADEQWRALRAVKHLLPPGIVEWEKVNGHWPNHPLPADYVWSDGFPRGVSRIYAAMSGADFWVFPIDVRRHTYLWARWNCDISIYSPLTGALIDTAQLKGGQIDTINEADGRRWFRGPVQANGQPVEGHAYVLKGPEDGGLWGYFIHGKRT